MKCKSVGVFMRVEIKLRNFEVHIASSNDKDILCHLIMVKSLLSHSYCATLTNHKAYVHYGSISTLTIIFLLMFDSTFIFDFKDRVLIYYLILKE